MGTAQRILSGETSVGIEILEQLATAFRVTPWQLLVPGLDARNLPGLTADETAWPFPMVDRRAYRSLGADDRVFVQGAMSHAISERLRTKPAAAA